MKMPRCSAVAAGMLFELFCWCFVNGPVFTHFAADGDTNLIGGVPHGDNRSNDAPIRMLSSRNSGRTNWRRALSESMRIEATKSHHRSRVQSRATTRQ